MSADWTPKPKIHSNKRLPISKKIATPTITARLSSMNFRRIKIFRGDSDRDIFAADVARIKNGNMKHTAAKLTRIIGSIPRTGQYKIVTATTNAVFTMLSLQAPPTMQMIRALRAFRLFRVRVLAPELFNLLMPQVLPERKF